MFQLLEPIFGHSELSSHPLRILGRSLRPQLGIWPEFAEFPDAQYGDALSRPEPEKNDTFIEAFFRTEAEDMKGFFEVVRG